MDNVTDLAKKLRPFLVSVASSVVRTVIGNKILLWHSLVDVRVYDVSSVGLDQALAAAVSGDHIELPGACTIDGSHTMTAGITMGGKGGNSKLTGKITLTAGSGLRDLSIVLSGTGQQIAVLGPASGAAFLRDCYVSATSSDGSAYGVIIQAGNVILANCNVVASGDPGVGIAGGEGDGYIYGGQAIDGDDFDILAPAYDLLNEYFFPTDLQGWIEDLYASSGTASDYSAVTWDAVQGKTDPGSVKCNLFAAASNDRSAGIKIFPINKSVAEGDVFRAWFLLTDMTLGGVVPLEGYVQVYYTDGTNAFAYDRPVLSGPWKDVTYTVPAGDAGKTVAYIIVFVSTNGNTTGICYIDDVLLPWAETYGDVYTNGPELDDPTEGTPLLGDRAAWDVLNWKTRHTNDEDASATAIHHTLGTGASQAAQGSHLHAGQTITPDGVLFDTTPTVTPATGLLSWNVDRDTLDLGMPGNVTLQLGQEMHYFAINQTGSPIADGTVVQFDGALGASGIIKCKPAVADGTVPAIYIMGVATQDIPNGETGKITFFGEVRGFDTSGWAAGTILYVDPTTPGGLTDTEPDAPNLKYAIAATLDSTNNGTLFVRAIFGLKLRDLDDVQEAVSPADKDLLSYVLASSRWEQLTRTAAGVGGLELANVWTANQRINGRIGINIDPDFTIHAQDSGDTSANLVNFVIDQYSNATAGTMAPRFTMRRARGTPESPSQILTNERIFNLGGYGYGTLTPWNQMGNLILEADTGVSGDDIPARWILYTHRAGDTAGAVAARWGVYNAGDILHTPVHDTVDSVKTVRTTRQRITTGTVAVGFGQRHLYQLRSSTTNDQDAGALDVVWSTATHASRTSRISLSPVVSASMVERLRLADVVQIGDVAGGNYTEIENDGSLEFVGTATAWEDLRVEPTARTTGANAPTFEKWLDDSAGTSRGAFLYSFDDATAGSEKELFFVMQMPHAWAGTSIYLHVHWIGAVDDTTAEPRWGLEYAWRDIGEVFGDTTIIYAATKTPTDANVTAFKHYLTAFSAIAPGATADGISSVFVGRLFRDSANVADTYNATGAKCGLLAIDAHYEINTIGSRSEYIK